MTQPFLLTAAGAIWVPVRDANPTALAIFHRHYSWKPYRDGRKPLHFVGPGEKLVLLTPDARALFVWRKFICGDGQGGVNCAVFRNEGEERASDLIRAAVEIAWERWPGERLYTYVNPRKVKRTRTPGRCFLKAGWHYLLDSDGKRYLTKCRKLLVLYLLPPTGAGDPQLPKRSASSASATNGSRRKPPNPPAIAEAIMAGRVRHVRVVF